MKLVMTEIYPGLIHVISPNYKETQKTWIRFEEAYENPVYNFKKFKKSFSKKDILKWWKTTKFGKDNPYWFDAFNIPSYVLKPFYDGKFNPLDNNEKELLELLKPIYKKRTAFYIIGTEKSAGHAALKHEIAHGLYYISKPYRKEVDNIMKRLNKKIDEKLNIFLREVQGYGEHVLADEKHTWILADTKREIEKAGVSFKDIYLTRKALGEAYARIFKKH